MRRNRVMILSNDAGRKVYRGIISNSSFHGYCFNSSQLSVWSGCYKVQRLPVGWGLGALEAPLGQSGQGLTARTHPITSDRIWEARGALGQPQFWALGTSLGTGMHQGWAGMWGAGNKPCCSVTGSGANISRGLRWGPGPWAGWGRTGGQGQSVLRQPQDQDKTSVLGTATGLCSEQRWHLREHNVYIKLWATYFLFTKH